MSSSDFPISPADESALTAAYKVFQDSLSAAQSEWQSSLARGHVGFLQAMESAWSGLMGTPMAAQPVPLQARPAQPVVTAPAPVQAAPAQAAPVQAPAMPVARPVEAPAAVPIVAPLPASSAPAPSRPASGTAPAPAVSEAIDLTALLAAVVAEKTGFPVGMLEPSMALEADLGIDSIKRVEIFSALQERVPGLPEMDPGQMGSLRTLAEIASMLEGALPAPNVRAMAATASAAAAPAAERERVVAAPAAPAGPDLTGMVKRVVADKTGYPVEMLDDAMELEADLGIDSIKRVEIFSALQEALPHLPEMDPAQMGSLRKLADVAAALGATMPAAPVSAPAAPVPVTAAQAAIPAADSGELAATLLAVVAEKTGYPVEMLEPSMALEADLGIDSIKRVEIFSALQERLPSLPELDPALIGSLRTISEIVAALGKETGAGPAAAVTAPAPVAARSATAVELPARLRVVAASAPATGHALLRRDEGAVVITPDGRGVAEALAGLLQEQGFSVAVADVASPGAASWICLAGLRPANTIDEATAVHRAALTAAKEAAGRLALEPGAFVTVQSTGGDFASPDGLQAWSGGLAGLARTAAIEWPQARVKAIDIELGGRSAGELAAALVQELLAGGPEIDTGLKASGERLTVRMQEASAVTARPLPANAVVLATGGARGVTAACLIRWAEASGGGLRLALAGRTPLETEPEFLAACPTADAVRQALIQRANGQSPAQLQAHVARVMAAREVRQTLAALRAARCEAEYFAADGRSAVAMAALAEQVRRQWGPITAIVHGAGVLADKRIADLTMEQFDAVFSTKVDGLRALLDATAADPLQVLVLFSSVAARCGNQGQAAYAMANEVLNKVALAESRRRGPECVVKSIGWGPWDGGMVTPALARHFAQMGVPLIPLAGGTQALVNELAAERDAVEVVIGAPLQPQNAERQVRISRDTHPHLADHRIRNETVLPVVEALHLFLQAAEAAGRKVTPESQFSVRVLRGVLLKRYFNEGDALLVRARDGVFELVSPDGVRHYEGRAEHATGQPSTPLVQHREPWTGGAPYPELLFHGPAFQVIEGISGVSGQGISGTLQGRDGQPWRHGTAGYDPVLLDGGLQLALLWGRQQMGQATLPMRIGAVRLLQPPADHQPVECHVRAQRHGQSIVCDIEFRAAGALVALLQDVEMYAVSGI